MPGSSRLRSILALGTLLVILPRRGLCDLQQNAEEITVQEPEEAPKWYFWNEVTDETQWEDPGDVPYYDANGNRYWQGPNGERLEHDPLSQRYSWVEGWSDEHKRAFYYNQETKESTWDRPEDLAWRRVPYKDEL